MTTTLFVKVATELGIKAHQVAAAIKLLFEEECTIPFVARYRKEMTGSLDEVQLRDVRDRYHYLSELEASRAKYLAVVAEHCQKNPAFAGRFEELKRKFEAVTTRQELEDLYLPFKPKRRTRAMVAKERGLEPLLDRILLERARLNDLESIAATFVTPAGKDVAAELKVNSAPEALQGAADIYAERLNETADLRALVRRISHETGVLVSKKVELKVVAASTATTDTAPEPKKPKGGKGDKKNDASKYENYFDYREPLQAAASHRVMAVRRGEAEKFLRVSIEVDEGRILDALVTAALGNEVATDAVRAYLAKTVEDAYRRLLSPSIETELRLLLKTKAEDEAITVFAKNLQNLLLLPPIPHKVVLGVDPGLRTGCKLAVVDETGKLLANTTIHPDHHNEASPKTRDAKETLAKLIVSHKVQCIAVGNGTGSREIYRLLGQLLKERELKDIKRVVVNEAGASVYSTDEIAREEFPDLDATIRSAVSIARRLQDPLAELVKISPRSIGVGQYQHDVNPTKLTRSLEEVVESCVNRVGANLNTASYKLLAYVSGVGPTLAKSIVAFRDKNGKFSSRADLTKVAGLGPKAFQQAAGFLRVPESPNPLDNSAVHPERYEIVESIAQDLRRPLQEIVGKKDVVDSIPWEKYVSQVVGMPTLHDISAELIKPGRDPREDGSRLSFSEEVADLEDLKAGMILKGTVTNVTNFGAFVDIGVHQDGLVHISELSDEFVRDPSQVIAVGATVDVRVLDVDLARRRISLSRRLNPAPRQPQAPQERRGPPPDRDPRQQRPSGPNRPNGAQQGGQRDERPRPDGHRGPPPGRGRGPKAPDKHFTVDDLLAKFNKKGD